MITQRLLKSLYMYDETTGVFTRRLTGLNEAIKDKAGYLKIWVHGKTYPCHRMAWLYMYGKLPKDMIDHIDGDKTNNSLSNLREATNSQNQMNRRLGKNNKSGHKGVVRLRCGKWKAQLAIDKTYLYLGTFSTMEAALAARTIAEIKHFKEFRRK